MANITVNKIAAKSALVLIPAYNAARYLDELIPRIRKFVCDSNVLFVNDGSADETLTKLKNASVRYISFDQNRGKGEALAAGFRYAVENEYRSVLTIDADLQHLPEEIPGFFALDDGDSLVIGTRAIDLSIMPFARWLTNNLTSMIISVFCGARVRDSQSGFRLIPTRLLKSIDLKTTGYDFESEMLFKAGRTNCRIAEVPISTVYEGSESYINPFFDTVRFVQQVLKRIFG